MSANSFELPDFGSVARPGMLGVLVHGVHRRVLCRYAIASLASNATAMLVVLLCFGIWRLWSQPITVLVANTAAIPVSFQLHRRYTWQLRGQSHLRQEVLPFGVVALVGLLAASGAQVLLEHILVGIAGGHIVRTSAVELCNISVFAVLWIVKYCAYDVIFTRHRSKEPI